MGERFTYREIKMAYKDTLTLYEELIATGVPKEQASLQAHQLGSLGGEVVNTCNEIKEHLNKLDSKMDQLRADTNLSNAELKSDMNLIKSDMGWIRWIGYITIGCFLGNLVKMWVGH
jgi:DNA anti-recombination protein RmuC